MDPSVIAAILGLSSIAISAAAGYATHKSAAKSTERNLLVSSRTDIEKEAFDRAKEYYTDTIDRQDKERTDDQAEIERLKDRVKAYYADTVDRQDKERLDTSAEIERLKERVKELEVLHAEAVRLLARNREELLTAQRALNLRYPDE